MDGVSAADPETMRTALAQTERLGRLVETLLDLSRLDNGVVPLRARRFEVWPYLSGVLKEAGLAASQRAVGSGATSSTRTDVHLHLDVSPPELTAYADVERLHQVVANLVDNAVKHSPPHGRVTVRARRGPYPESLHMEVVDEGPGIPESERHKVFERFNRGSAPPRTGRAATAARDWGWPSRAGPWTSTAAASAWPNPRGAAASSSPFRGFRGSGIDIGFGPGPLRARAGVRTRARARPRAGEGTARGAGSGSRSSAHCYPIAAESRMFPGASCRETRRSM